MDEQPRAARRDEALPQPVDRRRNRHEPGGRGARGDGCRHCGSEREAAEIERPARPTLAAPGYDGQRVVALAVSSRIAAGRLADATEVEPHGVCTEARE